MADEKATWIIMKREEKFKVLVPREAILGIKIKRCLFSWKLAIYTTSSGRKPFASVKGPRADITELFDLYKEYF